MFYSYSFISSLLVYFIEPIERVINLQPEIQSAMVATDRFGEILDLEAEKLVDEDKKINPKTLLGDIEFKKVDFRYGTRKLVLKDINMKIKPGEKVALVGESGSGKTTIAELLMNFYDVTSGTIKENLEFANPEVSYEDIIEACKKAQIHDYINSTQTRYDTLLEEKGAKLKMVTG